jgi:hypothetical protein
MNARDENHKLENFLIEEKHTNTTWQKLKFMKGFRIGCWEVFLD